MRNINLLITILLVIIIASPRVNAQKFRMDSAFCDSIISNFFLNTLHKGKCKRIYILTDSVVFFKNGKTLVPKVNKIEIEEISSMPKNSYRIELTSASKIIDNGCGVKVTYEVTKKSRKRNIWFLDDYYTFLIYFDEFTRKIELQNGLANTVIFSDLQK